MLHIDCGLGRRTGGQIHNDVLASRRTGRPTSEPFVKVMYFAGRMNAAKAQQCRWPAFGEDVIVNH